MFGLPGLSVATRNRNCEVRRVSWLTSRRPSMWPVKSGRSRLVGADETAAVGRRRKGVAVAGERAAQIGDQGVALPVGDREKFRRDHVERRALRRSKAAGIGVVAARQLDRGLDQEAAGVVADRAERIVVDLQARARRLAGHGAGHRRRDRRLVGGLGRRDRQPHAASESPRRSAAATDCRDRAAVSVWPGPDRVLASCACG